MSAPTSSENKSLNFFFSENDIFSFEIEAGGTQFQADSDSRAAVETLVDGDQWMIYRNVITDVLHWDFVSIFSDIANITSDSFAVPYRASSGD